MKNNYLINSIRLATLLLVFGLSAQGAHAQQSVIRDINKTRPNPNEDAAYSSSAGFQGKQPAPFIKNSFPANTGAKIRVYPTTLNGNTMNINAGMPVRQLNVFASDGSPVYAKALNGQRDYIPVILPTLQKGMYFAQFIGDGWTSTERVIIP